MFSFIKKLLGKLHFQKTIKSDESSDTESRSQPIVEELEGKTDEEMIRLRVLNECQSQFAARPTEQESREIQETLEFLAIKNRYLRIQPRNHVWEDGTVIPTMVYVVD